MEREEEYNASRRNFLTATGTAAAFGLAGCSGLFGGSDEVTEEGSETYTETEASTDFRDSQDFESGDYQLLINNDNLSSRASQEYLGDRENLTSLNKSDREQLYSSEVIEGYNLSELSGENVSLDPSYANQTFVDDEGNYNITAIRQHEDAHIDEDNGTVSISAESIIDFERAGEALEPSENDSDALDQLDTMAGVLEGNSSEASIGMQNNSTSNETSIGMSNNSIVDNSTGMTGNTTTAAEDSGEDDYITSLGFGDLLNIYQDAVSIEETDGLVNRFTSDGFMAIEHAYNVGQVYEEQAVFDENEEISDASQHILAGVLTQDESGNYKINDAEIGYIQSLIVGEDDVLLPENPYEDDWSGDGVDNTAVIQLNQHEDVDLDPLEDYSVWSQNAGLEGITVSGEGENRTVSIEQSPDYNRLDDFNDDFSGNITYEMSWDNWGNFFNAFLDPIENLINNPGDSDVWDNNRPEFREYGFTNIGRQILESRENELGSDFGNGQRWSQSLISLSNIGAKFMSHEIPNNPDSNIIDIAEQALQDDPPRNQKAEFLRKMPEMDLLTDIYLSEGHTGPAFEFLQVMSNDHLDTNFNSVHTASGQRPNGELDDDTLDEILDDIEDNGIPSSRYSSIGIDSAHEVIDRHDGSSSGGGEGSDSGDDEGGLPSGPGGDTGGGGVSS